MTREARRRTPRLPGSPLVRQLARLTQAEAPESKQAFAERLSQWLGWTDAISLSAALGTPAAAAAPSPAARHSEPGPLAAEASRLHAMLTRSLADNAGPAADTRGRARWPASPIRPADEEMTPGDFSPHRRHYHARQQTMEAAVGPLRARLRGALSARSPALARLAAVDAVMEQALGERERGLLSAVPVLLERRFEQLRQAHAAATPNDATDTADAPAAASPPAAWLAAFRQDMQQLLLAELDHRWQPITGLLAALRAAPLPPTGHPPRTPPRTP